MIDQSRQEQSRSDGQLAHSVAFRPHLLDRRDNLPSELTSLVGRADAIKELRRLLINTRLLTLTGPGGIGKTRLALALGRAVLPDYPDGVWLVELAPVAAPALVVPTVGAVLGIVESGRPLLEHLAEVLRPRAMLVVLDNCEHVGRTCAELAESLLRACPDLQILGTSRERLDVRGEVVWRVPGLTAPEPGGVKTLQQIEKVEAVQLFVERAHAASGLESRAQDSAAIATICRQLEGMPLAIELAAGRTNVLTPQEIARNIGDLAEILTGGSRTTPARQQTMHATLDWSYGLLSESERTLFSRLSVFVAGWTLEVARAICADLEQGDPIQARDMLTLIARLVDQSLAITEPTDSGEMRYRMLEPVRQYAAEQLRKRNEEGAIRAQHRDWCLTLAEAAWSAVHTARERSWMVRLESEHANLRAALEFSLNDLQGAVPALRLAGALHGFWVHNGHSLEGRGWLTRAIEFDADLGLSAQPAAKRARLRALNAACNLARLHAEFGTAEKLCAASVALGRELDDVAALAYALREGAVTRFNVGDLEHGRRLLGESLELWRRVGDPWGIASILDVHAYGAASRGDYTRAMEILQERLKLARASGDPWQVASAQIDLGSIAAKQGQHNLATDLLVAGRRAFEDLDDRAGAAWASMARGWAGRARGDMSQALRCFGQGLATYYQLGSMRAVAECLGGTAGVLADVGQFERATRVMASAAALRRSLRYRESSRDEARVRQEADIARVALGNARFDAIWANAELLTVDEAIADALSLTSSVAAGASIATNDGCTLTPREVEVASLVALGRSNREIAEELVIAVSTSERHIANILRKLDLTSRTRLASWVYREREQGRFGVPHREAANAAPL